MKITLLANSFIHVMSWVTSYTVYVLILTLFRDNKCSCIHLSTTNPALIKLKSPVFRITSLWGSQSSTVKALQTLILLLTITSFGKNALTVKPACEFGRHH